MTWPDKPWWYPRERRYHTWTSEGLRWRTVENASYGTLNARRIFFIRLRCQLAPGSGAAGELGPDKTSRRDVFLTTIDLTTIDTLCTDHIHCCGYDRAQTPSLDPLANLRPVRTTD